MPTKYAILVAGPTAVGKSAIALQLAQHYNTSILSADARQCYIEMNIGTAKPTMHELDLVPHYFINSHSITDTVSAGTYESYGLAALDTIFKTKDIAIICGGTGLYVQALLQGMDDMPSVPADIQEAVIAIYNKDGINALQLALQQEDKVYAQRGNMENPARMMRALSFYRAHQSSILQYQQNGTKTRNFEVIGIGLERERAELYSIINNRVDKMVAEGLIEEAQALFPYRHLKSLQTVGYSEFYTADSFPTNSEDIKSAIDKIKQHSRNYAKRQLTWFKNRHNLQWFQPEAYASILAYIEGHISAQK